MLDLLMDCTIPIDGVDDSSIIQLTSSDIVDVRLHMLSIQGGVCPICKRHIVQGNEVLDHQHIKRIGGTGLCRGVLCRSCNIFIGLAENNSIRYCITKDELPTTLRNIADYLERNHYPLMHPSEKKKEPELTKQSYNKLKSYITKLNKDIIKKNATLLKDTTLTTKQLKSLTVKLISIPGYPPSKKMTVKLKALFENYNINPEYYK